MKKIFAFAAVAAAILLAGNANAQVGVNFGYGPQTYETTIGNTSSTTDLNSFFLGVNYNQSVATNLNISIGLQARYNFMNGTTATIGNLASVEYTHSQLLLDVPSLLNYTFQLGSVQLIPFIGPTVSLALSGKTVTEANTIIVNGNSEYDWYGDNSERGRFDVGVTVGLCAAYKAFRLYGGYNMGIMNTSSNSNTEIKSSAPFLGIGYAL